MIMYSTSEESQDVMYAQTRRIGLGFRASGGYRALSSDQPKAEKEKSRCKHVPAHLPGGARSLLKMLVACMCNPFP